MLYGLNLETDLLCFHEFEGDGDVLFPISVFTHIFIFMRVLSIAPHNFSILIFSFFSTSSRK